MLPKNQGFFQGPKKIAKLLLGFREGTYNVYFRNVTYCGIECGPQPGMQSWQMKVQDGLACDPRTENIIVAGGNCYWMVVSNIHYFDPKLWENDQI